MLLKGNDPNKDQSYFLHKLDQKQISNALFPIGKLKKSMSELLQINIALQILAKRIVLEYALLGNGI